MQVDLTLLSTVLGMSSIIFGVIASLISIRRFITQRKLSIFLEFHRLLYDIDFIKDMNEVQAFEWTTVENFFAKYGPDVNPDAFAKFTRVGSYFDGLCRLVEKKLIDLDFIPETTVIALIGFWEKFMHQADEFAVAYRRPNCWDSIKLVYERLHKLDHPHPHN